MSRRWIMGAVLLALVVWAVWAWQDAPRHNPRLEVVFLDVGQGDAAVVRTPNGRVLVVDAGGASPSDDQGRRTLLPFLRSRGINRLDGLLLTHGDADHAGGAATLMERMPVGCLLGAGGGSADPAYERALQTARRHGVKVVPFARRLRLEFRDGVIVEALNPPQQPNGEAGQPDNHRSIVLRLRYRQTALLLMGDADEEAEDEMARSGLDLGAQVMKCSHHGSRHGTTEALLDAIKPRVAVISVGKRNVYGHPHPSVLSRLSEKGVRVFRTDRDGAITITSDGAALRVTTVRGEGR